MAERLVAISPDEKYYVRKYTKRDVPDKYAGFKKVFIVDRMDPLPDNPRFKKEKEVAMAGNTVDAVTVMLRMYCADHGFDWPKGE